MNEQQITAVYEEQWNRAKAMFSHYPKVAKAPMPQVRMFARGAVAGRAHRNGSMVEFNTAIAAANGVAFTETIIHEIAHIIQYMINDPRKIQPHGREFHSIMQQLNNGKSSRCHSYEVPGYVQFECSCKTYCVSPQKASKMRRSLSSFFCKKCKSGFKELGMVPQVSRVEKPVEEVKVPVVSTIQSSATKKVQVMTVVTEFIQSGLTKTAAIEATAKKLGLTKANVGYYVYRG